MHRFIKTIPTLKAHAAAGSISPSLAKELLAEERAGKARNGILSLLSDLADAEPEDTTIATTPDQLTQDDAEDALAAVAAAVDDHNPLELPEPDPGAVAPKHIKLRRAQYIPAPGAGQRGVRTFMPRGEYRGEYAAHVYGYCPEDCDIIS